MAAEMMEKEFQKLHLFSLWVFCWPSGHSLRETDLSTDIPSALAQHPGCVSDTAGNSVRNNCPLQKPLYYLIE